ncbi:MAG: histidinol-phosphatase HisJ [Promethearchaeota archaeon]|nr:MAG: histidinol-phosphatase HisJ [Candidatus Lokiarchaeota archaeon]
MILEDWHTHSEICHHAVGSIEDYIQKAIEKNLTTIGICDHFPYEYLKNIERIPYSEYAMELGEIESYISTVEALREKYDSKINTRVAFEIDFFVNQEKALNFHLNKVKERLDYIIGSIHILNFHDGRGAWGFDDSRFREDFKYYGSDKVYLEYFKTQQKMLKSKKFELDIIGHFDLPKKFNDLPFDKELINNHTSKTLELIRKRDLTMEINTGGLRKEVKQQYPSKEIIKEIYEKDIPVLLGSDAHAPDEVAYEFRNMIKILKEIGFNQLAHYSNRKRDFIEI